MQYYQDILKSKRPYVKSLYFEYLSNIYSMIENDQITEETLLYSRKFCTLLKHENPQVKQAYEFQQDDLDYFQSKTEVLDALRKIHTLLEQKGKTNTNLSILLTYLRCLNQTLRNNKSALLQ